MTNDLTAIIACNNIAAERSLAEQLTNAGYDVTIAKNIGDLGHKVASNDYTLYMMDLDFDRYKDALVFTSKMIYTIVESRIMDGSAAFVGMYNTLDVLEAAKREGIPFYHSEHLTDIDFKAKPAKIMEYIRKSNTK